MEKSEGNEERQSSLCLLTDPGSPLGAVMDGRAALVHISEDWPRRHNDNVYFNISFQTSP